jgi:acyl-CoA thioesterase FadM
VNYLHESFYGDVLDIELSIGEISAVSFELFYSITTNRKNDCITIAKAKTGIVFYDYHLKKATSIPPAFRNILEF